MAKSRTQSKTEKLTMFEPEPDAWNRFERAADAVVKASKKQKAAKRPARIVKKSKPSKD